MYRFSYAPKRDYPYKWLTPLVVLVATTTNDINALQAGYSKSNGLVKFLRRNSDVSCDNTSLPVNSEIFTKNYALPYTIRSVWQQNADETKENQNALTYREHALNDCNVTSVGITVNGKYSQSPLISARTRVGLAIDTQVTCAIEVDTRKNQKTYFNLESAYNLLDNDIPRFLLKNATSSPSLFWGQSLLSLYYLVASHAYFNASRGESWGYPASNTYSAFINLTRQSTASVGGLEEVLSDDFFHVYCTTEDNVCKNNTIPLLSKGGGTGAGHDGSPYPTIWPAINILGKAMWFTVMTDLGQKNITVPNMLADANLLANLTSNVTNEANAWLVLQNSTTYGSTIKLDTSLAYKSFDPSATPAPALGVNTTYFSANYICQTPMLKPLGTRFVAILSSSLVLLHTIWNIFWFVFNLIIQGRLQQEADHVVGVHTTGDTSLEDLEEKTRRKANNYIQVNQAERHLD
ncbi:hypothetical protein GQX73_g2755 [Xylaria multiplex]|uniref:Uncharacterized protein n=1 Tax=Xylaria multiplex TaxID=323545 RepID=A0A7C8MT19_9PEZI|nr:hypothetical protein GQX73_g2755 [Xylaria multiplex]